MLSPKTTASLFRSCLSLAPFAVVVSRTQPQDDHGGETQSRSRHRPHEGAISDATASQHTHSRDATQALGVHNTHTECIALLCTICSLRLGLWRPGLAGIVARVQPNKVIQGDCLSKCCLRSLPIHRTRTPPACHNRSLNPFQSHHSLAQGPSRTHAGGSEASD